jgi:outer membrane receptor protein involved in Fe transport
VSLTASYNDAIYTDYKNAPCAAEKPPAPFCDLTGERVYLTPKWIVNPSVSFDHTFDRLTLYTNVAYSWRSEFYGSADSSELAKLDAYGILNARIGVRGQLQQRRLVGGTVGQQRAGRHVLPVAQPGRLWGIRRAARPAAKHGSRCVDLGDE